MRRLADAQARASLPASPLNDFDYVEPGVLWWVFNRASALRRGWAEGRPRPAIVATEPNARLNRTRDPERAVVLIDELDKADPDVSNALLVPLGSLRFRMTDVDVEREAPPDRTAEQPEEMSRLLVVITTDGRAFHAQLLITTGREGSLQIMIASAAGHRMSSVDSGQLMRAREMMARLDRRMDDESVRRLAELLLPRELQEGDVAGGDLMAAVDAGSAAWPWELVIGSRVGRPALATMGVIRRMIRPEGAPPSPAVQRTAVRALVAVASGADEGPGVRGGRADVDRLLSEHGIQVTVVREGARELFMEQLTSTEYDILHVIGSSAVVDQRPEIVLERGGHLLTPADLSLLRTMPALVFLDIHAAARGENSTSEGRTVASTFAGVVVRAGATLVVVSAWPIEDVLSAGFVRRFYQELLSGKPFLDAVKAARWEVFERDRRTHRWASFQCYGEADYRLSPPTSPPSEPSAGWDAARRLEQRLVPEPGLYRCYSPAELRLEPLGRLGEGEEALLLIHGIASGTRGTFGDLWAPPAASWRSVLTGPCRQRRPRRLVR